ncbi:MAG: hypothetical protein U1E39_10370 [Planctomycetota bacterium]
MATTRRKTKRANRDLVRLFHPTWTRVDPATGRVVERGEVATWWIDYRENGRRIRQNLRTENRTDAERLAGEVRERLRRAAVGLAPTKVDGVRALPFWRHVRGFLDTLRARGAVGQYRDDVRLCLYKALRATHPRPWRPGAAPDLDVGPVAAYLVEIQRRGLGARSVNRRVGALRAFGRWLVENRRTPFNPYAGLRPVNVETDRRRVRRSLAADEVARLLEAARTRPLAEARATAAAEAARRAAGAPPRRTAAEVTDAAAARLRPPARAGPSSTRWPSGRGSAAASSPGSAGRTSSSATARPARSGSRPPRRSPGATNGCRSGGTSSTPWPRSAPAGPPSPRAPRPSPPTSRPSRRSGGTSSRPGSSRRGATPAATSSATAGAGSSPTRRTTRAGPSTSTRCGPRSSRSWPRPASTRASPRRSPGTPPSS